MSQTGRDEWPGDLLNRKQDADYLTEFLTGSFQAGRYRNGSFVLNLNSQWGYGKTFLLGRWAEDLRAAGHLVVLFDAWRNDFSDDALLSFISEVSSDLMGQVGKSEPAKKRIATLRDKGIRMAKATGPILTAAMVRKLTGMGLDQLEDYLPSDESCEVASESEVAQVAGQLANVLTSQLLVENEQRKKSLQGFVDAAEELVRYVENSLGSKRLPIFVFVDELDRCRPTYSIELLESIKHLFPTRGFCFVVATDSTQLSRSIRAVYGNDFDSSHYLKRFFDMEYQLPEPSNRELVNALFCQSDLGERLYVPQDVLTRGMEQFFSDVVTAFDYGPRDIHQIFDLLEACCLGHIGKLPLHLCFLLPLICLKHSFNGAYEKFKRNPNRPSLSEWVKLARDRGKIKEQRVYQSHRAGHLPGVHGPPDQLSIFHIFLMYAGAIGKNLASGRTNDGLYIELQIESELRKQLPEVQLEDEYYSDLETYFELVDRAGNLRRSE